MQSPTQRLDHPTHEINIIIFPSGAVCWETVHWQAAGYQKFVFKFFYEKIDDSQKAY